MTNEKEETPELFDLRAVPDSSRDFKGGYNGPPPDTTYEAKPVSPPPPPVKEEPVKKKEDE